MNLSAQLNRYRYKYYNLIAPTVSDEVYDRLEQELGIQMGNSPTQTVGWPVVNKLKKIFHSSAVAGQNQKRGGAMYLHGRPACAAYKDSGIEGLMPKRPTGKHRKLTDEQEAELCSMITEKLAKEVDLDPYCNWTAPLACKYVKAHYGVTFSERGMREVFYRLELSYIRPTLTVSTTFA